MGRVVEQFAALFQGRHDAQGTERGGAERRAPVFDDHLDGTSPPIGIYPVAHNTVRWGCVDLDVRREGKTGDYANEEDAHTAALNLRNALVTAGIPSWIERTRSRGRHVWVFVPTWIGARTMRRALLVACQLADVPPREVNPKSEHLEPHELGNYVRLPYPGWLGRVAPAAMPDTRVMVDDGGCTHTLWGWLDRVELALPSRVGDLAALYVPPPPRTRVADEIRQHDGQLNPVVRRLNGLAFTIFTQGPHDGDRSRALWALARACEESGLNMGEAFAILADADARWGKMHARSDGERQLQRIIERAY